MAEIMLYPTDDGRLPSGTAADQVTILDAMRDMAAMLGDMNRQIRELEEQVRRLEKVTPQQAAQINLAIRERAAAVCGIHRAESMEKAAASAIRKALRLTCGISSVRELPRCDYKTAMMQIEMWDDYRIMKELKKRGRDK